MVKSSEALTHQCTRVSMDVCYLSAQGVARLRFQRRKHTAVAAIESGQEVAEPYRHERTAGRARSQHRWTD
jgi:hypothetical protein